MAPLVHGVCAVTPSKAKGAMRCRSLLRCNRCRQRGKPLLAAGSVLYILSACAAFVGPYSPDINKKISSGQPAAGISQAQLEGSSDRVRSKLGSSTTMPRESEKSPGFLVVLLAAFGMARTTSARLAPKAAGSSAVGILPGEVRETETKADAADSDALLPKALLLLMALCCSTNFTLVKLLEDGHSESAVASVRFAIALLPFLPLIPKHFNWVSIASGVEIGLWCTLGYVSQAVGLPHTEASTGAFLTSLAMVVVPLVKSAFGYEVRAQVWAAVALAVFGTGLLVGVGSSAASAFGLGECLCTVTALGFGLMFARMDEHAKHPEFDAMGCTVWQVVTLALAMLVWALATDGASGYMQEATAMLSSGPQTLGILAWVGFVTTAGVLYIETWAMEKVDGSEAGIIFASEPVWATIFASVVLGERFGFHEAAGGACILLACLLTQLRWDTPQGKPVA
mmetsp:Transcript_65426/g.151823  ORF Transcript_65426/g.151823 Transcript_65426/m.151823 type:complete len:454 (-) Transcript_65426:93-1454(-)